MFQQSWRKPVAVVCHVHHLVHQAGDVLSGRHARDWSREDVVEHQRRNAYLREVAAQSFFHHAVNASAREHRATFDVDGSHGEAEQHDAEDEPWRSRAYCLFGDTAGVKS